MSKTETYKGVRYRIVGTTDGRWQWEISPTLSVRGLQAKKGVALGKHSAAIAVVKREIDAQYARMLSQVRRSFS
jgi:hypothetical protein